MLWVGSSETKFEKSIPEFSGAISVSKKDEFSELLSPSFEHAKIKAKTNISIENFFIGIVAKSMQQIY